MLEIEFSENFLVFRNPVACDCEMKEECYFNYENCPEDEARILK